MDERASYRKQQELIEYHFVKESVKSLGITPHHKLYPERYSARYDKSWLEAIMNMCHEWYVPHYATRNS